MFHNCQARTKMITFKNCSIYISSVIIIVHLEFDNKRHSCIQVKFFKMISLFSQLDQSCNQNNDNTYCLLGCCLAILFRVGG